MLDLEINLNDFHGWQKDLLLAREPFICCSAGYGSGKTTIGAVKKLYNATLNAGYPQLIIAPTWTTMKSVIVRKMQQVLLQSGVPRQRVSDLLYIHDPKEESYWDWGGGTIIYLRSAKNPGSYEGLEVADLWIDEARLITEEAYRIAMTRARLRKAALVQRFLTTTPAMHWLATQYNGKRKGHRLIQGSTRDNVANLDPDYITGLEASFSKRMLRAILDGEFVPYEGAVFESFDSKHHQWEGNAVVASRTFDRRQTRNRKTYLWIDPGGRRASIQWVRQADVRVNVGTYDPLNWVVFRQLQTSNQSMADTVMRIIAINKAESIDIDEIWVDPAADQKGQIDFKTVADVLRKIPMRNLGGIRWLSDPYRSIVWGIERVNALLGDPDEHIMPRLWFTKELIEDEQANPNKHDNRGVVKSLSAYQYPEHKPGRPYTEHPLKDGIHDHAVDAIRYGAAGLYLSTDLRYTHPLLRDDANLGYTEKHN